MADGKTHARDSALIAAISGAALIWWLNPAAGIACGAGSVAGIQLTPDLDQEGISRAEWHLVRRTYGLGFLWLAWWFPYAIVIPHRHWISHTPIVSTAIRLTYLMPLWVLLWYGGLMGPWLVWFGLGLALSDLAHWVRDSL